MTGKVANVILAGSEDDDENEFLVEEKPKDNLDLLTEDSTQNIEVLYRLHDKCQFILNFHIWMLFRILLWKLMVKSMELWSNKSWRHKKSYKMFRSLKRKHLKLQDHLLVNISFLASKIFSFRRWKREIVI